MKFQTFYFKRNNDHKELPTRELNATSLLFLLVHKTYRTVHRWETLDILLYEIFMQVPQIATNSKGEIFPVAQSKPAFV